MEAKDYLSRIGIFENTLSPTKENLHLIHKNHLMHVPFENLDLHMGTEVTCTLERCWEKIVKNNRGGWCFEHTLVLDKALSQLGYKTRRGTGQVIVAGVLTPPGSHSFVHVFFDDGTKFLVDVGFPDTATSALEFSDPMLDIPQATKSIRQYKITKEGSIYFKSSYVPESDTWNKIWQWDDSSPTLQVELYDQGTRWAQGPDSPFIKNTIISMVVPSGRITLSGLNKIVTDETGRKTRTQISREEFIAILKDSFGVDLPNFFEKSDECNPNPVEGMFK